MPCFSFQLRVHYRSHTSSRPFTCTKCNNSFSRPEDLKRHGLNCNGPRHSCPTCTASFRSRAALDSHSIWAPGCGRLGTGVEREAVKLDLGRVAVVGVDCQNLVDSEVFTECQRKRRYIFSSDPITFLKGVACVFLAPKLPSVVHAELALVLTGEPLQ